MSDALLNAGRQTLMLELQEASRLPERLGDDFVRAASSSKISVNKMCMCR
ncbi:hypothetical protein I7U92_002049 [Salmonella enterica]|nr:hypothetical protein [Salmonella enterica]EGR8107026.1 hypothetical protein [Salmonella enterica]